MTKKNCLSTLCGTAAYVAPEVLNLKSKGYDERADLWSCGVVAYILLGGYAPFEGPLEKLAILILKGDYEFHDEYWAHISNDAKLLVSSLLQGDPERRITAEEALQSDWMTAEEETLTVKDLSNAQEQIRKALPVEKLRGAVKAVRPMIVPFNLRYRPKPCFLTDNGNEQVALARGEIHKRAGRKQARKPSKYRRECSGGKKVPSNGDKEWILTGNFRVRDSNRWQHSTILTLRTLREKKTRLAANHFPNSTTWETR